MAIAYDSVGAGRANAAATSNTTYSESHTIVSSAPVMVVLGLAINCAAAEAWSTMTPGAVTFNGVAMTQQFAQGNNVSSTTSTATGWVSLWTLPFTGGAGTYTASVKEASGFTEYLWFNTVAYTGVGGINTVSSSNLNHGSSTNPTLTAASTVGNRVVAILGAKTVAVSSPTQTSRYSQSGTSNIESGYIQDAAGASSVTFGMTASTAAWGGGYIDLYPATSTTPSNLFFPFL